jgi:hypothetical protein
VNQLTNDADVGEVLGALGRVFEPAPHFAASRAAMISRDWSEGDQNGFRREQERERLLLPFRFDADQEKLGCLRGASLPDAGIYGTPNQV